MTKVRFLKVDGELDTEVEALAGSVLLDVAQRAGQPLEGACEGQMACSTCINAHRSCNSARPRG